MFKVYTQQNCPNCEDLKAFLYENGVEFEELDVNKDTKARAMMIMNDLETTPAIATGDNVFAGDLMDIKTRIENLL